MPDREREQPGRMPAGGRVLLRCLVLAGGVVAAWLLASGVATAAGTSTDRATIDGAPRLAGGLLSATGDAIAELADADGAPAELSDLSLLRELSELDGIDGLGGIDGLAERLPDLDRLDRLGDLDPVEQIADRIVDRVPGVLPVPAPDAPQPTPWLPVAVPAEASTQQQRQQSERPAAQRALVAERTAGQPASDSPAPASVPRPAPAPSPAAPLVELPPSSPAAPAPPAPTSTSGGLVADLPYLATAAALPRLTVLPDNGPAIPTGIANRPGTTPD